MGKFIIYVHTFLNGSALLSGLFAPREPKPGGSMKFPWRF